MANFERNDNLNEIIFTHSYSINRSLIFFHIILARSHLTASSPRKDEYPTPSFYTPFNFSSPVHKIVTIYGVHISMETQLSQVPVVLLARLTSTVLHSSRFAYRYTPHTGTVQREGREGKLQLRPPTFKRDLSC